MRGVRRDQLEVLLEPVRSPAPALFRPRASEPLATAEQLVSFNAPGSFEADQYRTLRHTIERLHRDAGLQLLAISSAAPGDGKSITALNLAGALAQSRKARVLIVDADLRRPRVAEYLGLNPGSSRGLGEAIADAERDWSETIVRLDEFNLSVLPAGAPQSAPYELLNAPRLETLLTDARRLYDFVLIDTPPLLPFPDGRVLSRLVDGFLVIVAAHRTPRKLVIEALRLLDPAQIIGVVFNGDDRARSTAYGYYGYSSENGNHRDNWRQ